MRNTSTADQVYEFGRNYVGIGFVDFFQIVWGQYKNDDAEDKALTFHGYDTSRVTTLRSKIIYGIMKYYTEEEISTLSLLQFWFSSCWDLRTKKAFDIVMQDALSNYKKYQLEGEDKPILEKWQKETVSKHQAEQRFSEETKTNENIFGYVFRMKNETDRVKFCRHLLTGSIFVDEKNIVCGNKTMFANVCGTEKAGGELFFKAIDLNASRFQKKDCFEDLLFKTIVEVTKNSVNDFRSFVKMGKIVCHLHTKYVDPEDMEFAATIQRLNPHSIDWSNVLDFFEKNNFIRFARACSVDDTVHTMHSLNWIWYIYGSSKTDWIESKDEFQKFYDANTEKPLVNIHTKKRLKQADRESMMSFFEKSPYYTNNLRNDISLFLAMYFRKYFEDFFLSEKNGKVLSRIDLTIPSSFFEQKLHDDSICVHF